jgi:hypothetical protein
VSGKLVAGSGKPTKRPSSSISSPPAAAPPRPLTAAEAAQRCSSQARGSIYDQAAGICCHFCRQVGADCIASPSTLLAHRDQLPLSSEGIQVLRRLHLPDMCRAKAVFTVNLL